MRDVAREHRPVDLGVGRGPGARAEADLPCGDEELAVDVHPLARAARREGELLAAPAPGGGAKAPALLVEKPPEVEVSHEVGARIAEAPQRGRGRPSSVLRRHARVPRAQDGRDHQDLRDTVELAGRENHPADPGVDGQPGEPPPEPGDAVSGVERAELAEQPVAVRDETAVRRVDERELVEPSEPARGHPEDDRREVRAPDLGRGEPRAGIEVLPGIEPHAHPRTHPPAPPPALIGGGARDRLDGKALDPGAKAVPADAGEPRVDHEPDAGHGDGGLRDVGRENHPPPLAGAEDSLLLRVVETGVEGQHLEPAVGAQGAGRFPDVALAGEEHQDVPRAFPRDRPHRLRHRRHRIVGSGVRARVADLDGVRPPRHLDDRGAVEEVRDALRFEGRGAHDHPEVGAPREHPLHVPEQEVDVERALVRFVDDEGVVGLEEGIARDLGHEDPVRHQLEVRIRADLVVEADLGPDPLPDPCPELARDAGRDAPRRDSARLGMADPAGRPPSRGEADLGELGRLPGAGLAANHHHRMDFDGGRDRRPLRGDGQLGGELGGGKPRRAGRAGGPRAGDGGLEPAARGAIAASKPAQPLAEAAPVTGENLLLDPPLEGRPAGTGRFRSGPFHRGNRFPRHGRRPPRDDDAHPGAGRGRSSGDQSRRLWVPSQNGAPPVRLHPHRNTRRASSSSKRSGTNSDPLWDPSQNGCRADFPHRHQK